MADQAYVDISSMGTTIDSGDGYLKAFKYENAVQAYQAAGAQSTTIAGELKQPPDVSSATTLANLRWQLASQATAQQAQSLAKSLLASLQAAYNSSGPVIPTSATVTPGAAPTKTNTPSTSTDSTAIVVGVILAVGVAGVGLWLLNRRRM
jgi:hypothetical protein